MPHWSQQDATVLCLHQRLSGTYYRESVFSFCTTRTLLIDHNQLPSPPLDVITLQQETRKEANLAQTNALSMLGWLAIRVSLPFIELTSRLSKSHCVPQALLTAYISCWKATSSCRYASVSLPNLVMLLGTSAAEHKLNIGSRGSGMVTIAMLSVVIISWT